MNDAGDNDALAKARETIERQAGEIDRLKRRLADERFAEDLREALTLTAATGAVVSPVSHDRLLEMIVETAANVIFARAGALFLIDEEAEELIFEVALGGQAEEVKKFRIPLGHGIAGLVAVSGQPMAVSEAENDPRQATDIAESVGYKPQSILCVPLFYDDRVIGVLELLDKEGASSFSSDDIQDLGYFANQAAVAIEQSRANRSLAALLGEMLGGEENGLRERAQAFAGRLEEDAGFERALELAGLAREIAGRGEEEFKGCRTILRGFADYLRSRSDNLL